MTPKPLPPSGPVMSALVWVKADGTEDYARNTVRAAARRVRFGSLEHTLLALAEDYGIKYPEWFEDLDWADPATAFRTAARNVEHARRTDLPQFDVFIATRHLRCVARVFDSLLDPDA